MALGRAHNVLSDEKWESADLGDVVSDVLEPLAVKDGNRLRTGGGEVRLPPRSALLIAPASFRSNGRRTTTRTADRSG